MQRVLRGLRVYYSTKQGGGYTHILSLNTKRQADRDVVNANFYRLWFSLTDK